MAVIENNPWIEGARGMVRGAIVYRQRAGRTIVSARPATSSKPLSEKQKAHHRRFREATAYSKRVKEDDGLFAKYAAAAEGFISWQNLAVRDYMHAPVVEKVVAEGFTGTAGEVLKVYASDDFGICSLRVTVMDGRGAVLERGECDELIANEVYAYNLKGDVDPVNGVRVRVEAADAAGNVTEYEEELYAGGDEDVSGSSADGGGGPAGRAGEKLAQTKRPTEREIPPLNKKVCHLFYPIPTRQLTGGEWLTCYFSTAFILDLTSMPDSLADIGGNPKKRIFAEVVA
ncbi:hypothetical protein AB9P05_02095 [Roseivirga sp. BDSF3-8]|uniref:hypothetical protein n=1 Tax=Roseivirga sp. BDSF3-8 TaxID=3241598 RepID=UPI0035327244